MQSIIVTIAHGVEQKKRRYVEATNIPAQSGN